MAVEIRIDATDEWFVGEDRVLRFRFTSGETAGIDGWGMELALYGRRAADTDAPLLTVPVSGFPETVGEPAYAVAQINGDQTALLGAGIYQLVLRRTDAGERSVLSFGPAELRSAVNA